MIWSGEHVFGQASAAFRGSAADNAPHAHVTIQITLASQSAAAIERPDGTVVVGQRLLVRPGASHTLRPIADVTLVFLEPQTVLGQRLLESVAPGDIVELHSEFVLPFARDVPLADALEKFERADEPVARQIDARVDKALAFLAQADGSRVVAGAAAAAGLSPSRLRALAHHQLGTPLTAWLAWRRLERAGRALAAGASLAEAAIDAGFADQAHLSRVTRQVFGITPATAGRVIRPQANPSRPK